MKQTVQKFDVSSLYTPLPTQRRFHQSTAKYRLLGGAAGGGKSVAIIWETVMRCLAYDFPITIALFRCSFPELEATIIRTMLESLPQWFYKYNQQQHIMTTYKGDHIEYCYAESDADVNRYQSREWDFLGIDELTHFCLHPLTQVLTMDGWKEITEVTTNDSVLSVSNEKIAEWKPVVATHSFEFDGIMKYVFERKGVSFCVTPNHKLVLDRKYGIEHKRVDELPNFVDILRTAKWRGETVKQKSFVHQYKGHNEVQSVSMVDWCEFLGWYLSEGYSFCVRKDKSPVVGIRQMKRVVSIERLLDRLGWRWKYNDDGKYEVSSRQLYEVVHPMGNLYQKRVPREIINLNAKCLQALWDAFVEGDGYRDTRFGKDSIHIGLANEDLVDDLQEVAIKLGYVATKGYQKLPNEKRGFDVWRLSATKQKKSQLKKKNIVDVPYGGKVYCLTVKDNPNFLMRYNGRTMWTGNSEYQFTYLLSRLRTTKPLKVKFFAATNPGSRGHKWVKDRWITKECTSPGYDPTEYEFIPSLIQDNTYLTSADPDYVNRLMQLPEAERKALLYGDWDLFQGMFFTEFDPTKHIVSPFSVPANWTYVLGWDDGTAVPRSVHLYAIDPDHHVWCIWEYYRKEESLPTAARNIKDELTNLGYWNLISKTVVDPSMKSKDPTSGQTCIAVLEGVGFGFKMGEIELGDNGRKEGWRLVKTYLSHAPHEEPLLKFFSICENMNRTLPQMVYKSIRNMASEEGMKNEDLDTRLEDHAVDDLRYTLMSLDTLPLRYQPEGIKITRKTYTPQSTLSNFSSSSNENI